MGQREYDDFKLLVKEWEKQPSGGIQGVCGGDRNQEFQSV